MPPLVSAVEVSGFRSIRHSRVALEPLCALVGEPEAGKSNLLAALRCVLDPLVAPAPADAARGGPPQIALEAELGAGGHVRLSGSPAAVERVADAPPPPVLYLPAAARGGRLLAPGAAVKTPAGALFRRAARDEVNPQPATVRALDRVSQPE